jgi:hypothetical protein
MQHAQHAHPIAGHVVDQQVALVNDQLTRPGNTAGSAEAGMIDQAGSLFLEQLVESQGRVRIIGLSM